MGIADRLRLRRDGVKWSVVVAVYNTGRYIEPCLASLLNQSLPASEYEVILVDDGSTDGTPARLDEVAAEHENVTAIHIPASGWPGRPRNVGVDAARGEYVYFVDHDDWLAPEALERMYAMAARNRADVVIGRIAGHGRRVPATLFARNHESCTLETAPLMESMTPHKGFRRAFLLEHGIRFPEGRRRLEDHVFVVEAYLRARVVSVLSDYTCYHHIARDDAANAGFQEIEPVGYYANLREAIDVADRLTEPGPRRDLVLRRWYRVEMLRRVTGTGFLRLNSGRRRVMYDEVQRLALERFSSPGARGPLGAADRAVSEALLHGSFEDVVALAEFGARLGLSVDVTAWQWQGGRLRFESVLGVATAKGSPAVDVVEGRARYAAPVASVPEHARAVTGPASAFLELRLRGRATRRRVPLDVVPIPGDGPRRLTVRAVVDPLDTGGTRLAGGVWDLFLTLRDEDVGPELVRRVGEPRGGTSPEPALLGGSPLVVIPYTTDKSNLSLDVGGATKDLAVSICAAGSTAAYSVGATGELGVEVTVDAHVSGSAQDRVLRVVAALDGGVEVSASADVRPAGPHSATLSAVLPSIAAHGTVAVETRPASADRALVRLAGPGARTRH